MGRLMISSAGFYENPPKKSMGVEACVCGVGGQQFILTSRGVAVPAAGLGDVPPHDAWPGETPALPQNENCWWEGAWGRGD